MLLCSVLSDTMCYHHDHSYRSAIFDSSLVRAINYSTIIINIIISAAIVDPHNYVYDLNHFIILDLCADQ